MSISTLTRAASGSLLRTLWNRGRSAGLRRRSRRPAFSPSFDQLENRLALAITSPLQIGGTTVASFLDTPTGPANVSDFVTVSIEGTKGTVIFNGGAGVPDFTDIQTIEIVDASPDFQLTFNATIQTANPVPYGSDGIVQLGKITTANVIRGINTVRGPLTNVAAPWEIETSAIHLYTFNDGTVSGSTVTDLIGSADGTLVNGASVSGGQLVLADNSGATGANVQYMSMPADVIPQGSTAATFELWFTASNSTGIWGRGFDLGKNDGQYLLFTPLNSGGGSRASITESGSGGDRLVDGGTSYNDNTQHLATVTVDDAGNALTYYIDGVSLGSVSLDGTYLSGLEAVRNFLGRSQFDQDPGFIGSMNQFAIYDRVLSASEIAANYAAGPIVGALTPIGFTQSNPGSSTLSLEGNQTTAFPVGAYVCATPLLPTTATPSFGTVQTSSYDSNTNITTITLDNPTAALTTAGALTLAERVQPEFVLTSFVGVNFSNRTLKEGGGIFVDRVIGADTVYNGQSYQNLGILLSQGLLAYSSIGIRDQLAATVIIGTTGTASADGRMFVESSTPESLIIVGPQTTKTAQNSKFQLIGGEGPFNAGVVFSSNFNGVVNLGTPATGEFAFLRNVGPLAVLNASAWNQVTVAGDFAGTLNATGRNDTSGVVNLAVGRNVAGTARVNGESDVSLNVAGSILKGAIVSSDQGTTFTVGGNLLGTIQAGSDFMSGAVAGSVTGATLASSNDIRLSVAGDVVNSTLAADDEFTLNVGRSVRGSTISSGDTEVTFNVAGSVVNSQFVGGLSGAVGGNVTNSQFFASGDDLDDADPDITLSVAGTMTNSAVQAVSQVTVAVAGNVAKSRFISTTSDVTVNVGGSITDSELIAADDGVTLTVGRDALNTKVVGDDSDVSLTVGRNYSGSVQSGSGNVFVDVGGSVLKASSFTTGGNASVNVGGNFDGSVAVDRLRYFVGGNVSKGSRIVAQQVTDNWGDFGGGPNFGIGGRLDGIVNVVDFDAAPSYQTVQILGNGAGSSARFYVDRFQTDDLVFNGNFNGNLRVGQDLVANLNFGGNVDRITIAGRVGSYEPGNTITPVIANIVVNGRLRYLNSNSYFQALVPGVSGIFWNDSLPVSSTGSLLTGGYQTVVPTLQTQPAPNPLPPQVYTVPGAPVLQATGLPTFDGINVSFTLADNGNLPVLYFEYSTDNGANWRRFTNLGQQAPAVNVALPGPTPSGSFTQGSSYQVLVRATNALGTGSNSNMVPITLAE